jgi:hypothetical protein
MSRELDGTCQSDIDRAKVQAIAVAERAGFVTGTWQLC